jgi:low temperature requirement protein LtrA
LATEYLGPSVAYWVPGLGRSDTREWNIDGTHIAERAGLFILIALGESILVTGMAFADAVWSAPVIAAMGVALIGSIAMWWIYFAQAAAAARAIAASDDPGRLARVAYTYVPILLIAGIVVVAVGDELVLHHPEGHVDIATALVLLGGPAIYLLGAALFKLSVFGTWSIPRLGGIVALLAMAPLATLVSPLILSAASTGALVLVALVEGVSSARRSEHYRMAPETTQQ